MDIRIHQAETADDWREASRLVEEYAASLNIDLGFQNFAAELHALPVEYGPPHGAFLLARAGDLALGCVGLHQWEAATGELKRLYVAPVGRAHGVGRRLAEAAIAEARRIGYSRLLLDTLPTMSVARALYRSLGFVEIPPYRHNPIAGTSFLALDLGIRPAAPQQTQR